MKEGPIAYLGPPGTYTEIALRAFKKSAQTTPCSSIAEVFESVRDASAAAGFVPLENVLEGPVNETFDLLLRYRHEVHIAESHVLPIPHGLGVRSSTTKLADIKNVYAHEQALRQCSKFLEREMPTATQHRYASNSAAVQFVSTSDAADAAIAHRQTLEEHALTVLASDISNSPDNKTRFALIKKGGPSAKATGNEDAVTSVAVMPGRDRQGLLYEILQIISVVHGINLMSIHSRPDTRGGFIFHLDLEGHIAHPAVSAALVELDSYCKLKTGQTTEICVLGSYNRSLFYEPAFKTIGIVGGKGVMGLWFAEFLSSAGYRVLVSDLDTDLSLNALAAESDVIVLSIPMSSAEQVIEKLASCVKPETLVVENCSIKHSALPLLESTFGKNIETLGIHTLFAGDISTIHGESVIVTKTKSSGRKARAFEDLLYKYGARITHASADEHDALSSYVQSLHHLVMICFAQVLRKNIDLQKNLAAFSTPNSRAVRDVLERVLQQSDELIVDLQTLNPLAPKIRHQFLEAFFELTFALDRNEMEHFLREVQACRELVKKEL